MPPRFVGLAGLGFLGRGIAQCLLNHGFHVIALEPRPTDLVSVNLTLASSAAELAPCELIIESITENLDAKQALFDEMEKHVSATVPIATNTSAIPITELQKTRKHPARFAGMHWTAPAYATRFMEVIRGHQTDDATILKIVELSREIGKEPGVVQKDLPGFVANRLSYAMYREALHLLEEGVADIETIDLLCRHSIGLWTSLCGPFRWMDITGGPALYATAMERILPTLSNQSQVPDSMRRSSFYADDPDTTGWQKKLHDHAVKTENS